jgi:hypothetical protein
MKLRHPRIDAHPPVMSRENVVSARFLAPGGRVWFNRSRTGERSVRWAAVQQPAQCSRRVAEVLSYGAAQMRLIGELEVGG